MADAASALRAIRDYVGLAIERRKRALPDESKQQIELLEDLLRRSIDGAHPAPRRIENPSPETARRSPVAPAKVQVTRKRPARQEESSGEAARAVEERLNASDREKLSSVSIASAPKSGYTPSFRPLFLSSYYDDAVVPAADIDPSDPPAALARPAMVHFLNGASARGTVLGFEPSTGVLDIESPEGRTDRFALADVLAVFFGPAPGEELRPPAGQRMLVQLVNGRQVTGTSVDYQPGAEAVTLVPDPRKGSVDHVWVPAWAVRAIEIL